MFVTMLELAPEVRILVPSRFSSLSAMAACDILRRTPPVVYVRRAARHGQKPARQAGRLHAFPAAQPGPDRARHAADDADAAQPCASPGPLRRRRSLPTPGRPRWSSRSAAPCTRRRPAVSSEPCGPSRRRVPTPSVPSA